MARLIYLGLPKQDYFSFSSTPISSCLFVMFSILSILAIVTKLCASHKMKKMMGKGEDSTKKTLSKLNSKAIMMVKLISWKKVNEIECDQHDYDDIDNSSDDDHEEVWRKTIIKGERCRPLEFSGKIAYDSKGNLLLN
ncbi:hypothetical protein ACFE04_010427 [Oxalis oulophora]